MTREIFRHRSAPFRVVCLTEPHLLLPVGHDPSDFPVRCLFRIERLRWFRWKPVRSPYHLCRREAVRRCRVLADYEIAKRAPRSRRVDSPGGVCPPISESPRPSD